MQSSSPPDAADAKAAFRKPSNDAGNRKYRRRSPVNGSPSSDGSPKHDRSSSPVFSREDPAKASKHQQRRRDDERELNRDSVRNQYGRGGDSYRYSDRQSARSSHGYSRCDEHGKHGRHANHEERNDQRSSSRTGRGARTITRTDYAGQESDHDRSKDYMSGANKSICYRNDVTGHRSKDKEKELSYLERQKYKDKDSSFDRAGSARRHTSSNSEETDKDWHKQNRYGRDEKRDYRWSSGDYRNDQAVAYEESRGHRNDSSGSDHGGHRLKEAYKSDLKELDGQKLAKEEKKKYDDRETNRDKDRCYREKADFASENHETLTKKPKFSNWDKGADFVKDVNRNLVGGGYLSTDQKKKLLWGNKKSTTAEESGHRWDTALFGDRDRQEKFNKLMSLRLPWYVWPIVGCERRTESRARTRQSRRQRSPPSREAEGTTVGFGKAVHSWTSAARWTHSWIRSVNINLRSVNINLGSVLTLFISHYDVLLYACSRIITLIFLHQQLVRHLSFCLWAFRIFENGKCHFNIVVFKSLNGFCFHVCCWKGIIISPAFCVTEHRFQMFTPCSCCSYLYGRIGHLAP
ncbi:cylicin-1-like isoform X2 [Mangifera indica]|uniref:cylicin-1-like isoform X2 n=1 Tax=Mangifera indica TaxID=29780 RepID=UPI001CFBED62|nr:cylicin-1-like isoform X2 [Mangifera indica]